MEESKLPGKIKIFYMVACLDLAILTSISSFWLPKAKPQDAPDKEFSAIRAMKHVEKVAAEIHPMGTPENEKVRDYIIGELSDLGLNVETQKTYSSNLIWGEMRSGEVENIYSILEGSGKDKDSILMMAHYDSTSSDVSGSDGNNTFKNWR